MKKSITILIALTIICGLVSPNLYAHSGRTDSSGGHHNRISGGYHNHSGSRRRPTTQLTTQASSLAVDNIKRAPRSYGNLISDVEWARIQKLAATMTYIKPVNPEPNPVFRSRARFQLLVLCDKGTCRCVIEPTQCSRVCPK